MLRLIIPKDFGKFNLVYRKAYPSKTEKNYRLEVFKANQKIIRDHNSKQRKKFALAVNEYSDLTFDEFKAKFLGDDAPLVTDTNENNDRRLETQIPEISPQIRQLTPITTPFSWPVTATAVDWRLKNAVTPIKNQGSCGSCWAFAEIAAVESAYAIFKETVLKNLSEQELVDCQTLAAGCSGGSPTDGFSYIQSKGISSETAYPYVTAKKVCKVSKAGTGLNKITGYKSVPVGPDALAAVLRKTVTRNSLCVDAAFQSYSSGVYNSPAICTSSNGHAVNAIGFNFSNPANRYFIIKNSWGTSWGQSGFGFVIASAGNGLSGRFTNPTRTYYPYF